jgi:hypothetical protein
MPEQDKTAYKTRTFNIIHEDAKRSTLYDCNLPAHEFG